MIELPKVTKQELLEAIREGVRRLGIGNAMPFSDLILAAVTNGVKEAHTPR